MGFDGKAGRFVFLRGQGKPFGGTRLQTWLADLETIIIDEVSMVRADLMDGVDVALRLNRGRPNEPFGGVQIVTVGDLHQLPPVVREGEEKQFLNDTYGGAYFFNAPVFGEMDYAYLELNHIFRQDEETFVNALNSVREGSADPAHLKTFNSRVCPFTDLPKNSGHVILTPINSRALDINTSFLSSLNGDEFALPGHGQGRVRPVGLSDQRSAGAEGRRQGHPAAQRS